MITWHMWKEGLGPYAIHNDCHGHTLQVFLKSRNEMLSSTEAELIRGDFALPQILRMRYFLEKQEEQNSSVLMMHNLKFYVRDISLKQGYTVTRNTFFQDNKSAIIEAKGKTANSKFKKHIKI